MLLLNRIVVVVLVAMIPGVASGQEPRPLDDPITSAFRRLTIADDLARAGRLGMAYSGYLAVLKDYPTWWLPTVKAAVLARALRLPADTIVAYLDRATGLSPSGRYLEMVRILLAVEAGGRPPDRAGGPQEGGVLVVGVRADVVSDRITLAVASAHARAGRLREAEVEYLALLKRRPGCPAARWGLAGVLRRQGRGDEAAALYREGATSSLCPARWRAEAERAARNPAADRTGP